MVTGMEKTGVFSSYQRDRLEQIQRFLVGIQDPRVAVRAFMQGYDSEQHHLGWDGWTTATGVDRPLDQFLTKVELSQLGNVPSEVKSQIMFLDEQENRWFPRARNAIRRFVAKEQKEKFEQAFFADMSQQPEGPLVVGSMEKFIGRFEDMGKSEVPGARKAYASLVQKGLDEDLTAEILKRIGRVKEGPRIPAPDISTEEIARAEARQHEAYEELNLWYIDWAEVFRQSLPHALQLKLGLIATRRSSEPLPEEPPAGEPPVDGEL